MASGLRSRAAGRREKKGASSTAQRNMPFSEVVPHNHEGDLWTVINGKVYNLTGWTHPGIQASLVDYLTSPPSRRRTCSAHKPPVTCHRWFVGKASASSPVPPSLRPSPSPSPSSTVTCGLNSNEAAHCIPTHHPRVVGGVWVDRVRLPEGS